MRIITTIKEISEALPGLLAVVPKRPTHALLANISVATVKENGREGIKLQASNLESFLTVFIPCQVIQSGSVCIPAKLLADVITKQAKSKSLGDLELLAANEKVVTLITNSGKQTLKGEYANDFIEFPLPGSTDKKLIIDGIEFFNKTKTLCNHVSKNSSNQMLQFVHLAHGKLAACDGHKLAYADLKANGAAPNIMIPPELMPILNKLNLVKSLINLQNTDITIGVQTYEPTNTDLLFLNFDNWELIQRTHHYQPLPNFALDESTIYSDLEFDRLHLIARIKAAIIYNGKKTTRLWLHLQAGNLYFATDNSSDSLAVSDNATASCLIEAERLLQIVDSLKVKTVKIRLPHSRNLLSIEVEDINIGLMAMEVKDHDQATLDGFILTLGDLKNQVEIPWKELPEIKTITDDAVESLTETKQNAVAALEPIPSDPTVDDKVQEVIAHLQSLLGSVTDVPMREAIVREVLAVV